MNDDTQFTDEQLRLATSRSLPPGSELDAETAALREGFLTVGQALADQGKSFDETALIARLQQSCREPNQDMPTPPSRRSANHNVWQLLLGSALAAAALIAIARLAVEWRQNHAAVVASVPPTISGRTGGLATSSPAMNLIGWQDPLDEQIALAQAEIERLGSRNRGFDGSLLDMDEQIRALSQELLGESL